MKAYLRLTLVLAGLAAGLVGGCESKTSSPISAGPGTGGFVGETGGFQGGTGGAFFTGGSSGDVSCNGVSGANGGGGGMVELPVGFSTTEFPPNLGTTISQQVPPPAVSGGTLLVLADGKTAVASDPDRDSVYVVDLSARAITSTIPLTAGDEPGRLVEDAAGHVQIALRHGGALVTIDPTTGTVLARRAVCAAPRGLAYDPATDLVHVACHDGALVSLPAAGGDAVRTLQLDDDLRDVVVSGTNLLVSRFRSAQLLTVAADGTIADRTQLPAFSSEDARGGAIFTPSVAWRTMAMPGGGVAMLHQRGMVDQVQPVAGGYGDRNACDTIVHPAITCVGADGTVSSGPALAGLVLAVDMAISPDGGQVAIISTGNATNTDSFAGTGTAPALTRVFVTDMASATDHHVGCSPDGVHAPCQPFGMFDLPIDTTAETGEAGSGGFVDGSGGSFGTGGFVGESGGTTGTTEMTGSGGFVGETGGAPGMTGTGGFVGETGGAPGMTGTGGFVGETGGSFGTGGFVGGTGGNFGNCSNSGPPVPPVVGQPIAVAYDGQGGLVVQSREPAMLAFTDGTTLTLSTVSREDTGHTLFHANSGGFLACASCHSEGNEDGRTWNFMCEGSRRTQSVQTGLRGTEPFHWGGDEPSFPQLMSDVFVGRMSGPVLATDQGDALLTWLDGQPRAPKRPAADPAAVSRGRTLFNDPNHGCAVCHAGSHLTNNATVDVGTGGMFQVPSLIGVGSRAPYMHNGCAATLTDRFGPCGGGDQHGITSTLKPGDVSDLVAYLGTL